MKTALELPTKEGLKTLDTSLVAVAESRLHEISFVTPVKAGDLLACFNSAHLQVIDIIGAVELELRKAGRDADMLRSIIILDKAKDILKSKGLFKESNPSGSEDMRRAILDSDLEYQDALDKVSLLKALSELYRNKMKSLEMSFYAVKSLIAVTNTSPDRETRTDGYFPEEVKIGEVVSHGRFSYTKPTY